MKNVDFGGTVKMSSWRKTALGTWKMAGDSQVYCLHSINVTPLLNYINKNKGADITITSLLGSLCGKMLEKHPQTNNVIRFGRLYKRKDISIFFHVATDKKGKDLSGYVVRNINHKSIKEVASELNGKARQIKSGDDKEYKKAKQTVNLLPGILSGIMLKILSFILYDLNLWIKALGMPRDSFGSMMITNVGSLGMQTALVPLVPYSRCGLLVAIGKVYDKVVARDGQIIIEPTIDLGWTLDHRLCDGVVAAQMGLYLEELIANLDQAS